jgi:hypothetical protein
VGKEVDDMNNVRRLIATGTFALLSVATLFGGAASVSAGETSTIAIHHRLCPTDVAVTDYFAQCHDELVGTALDFSLESSSDSQTLATNLATSNVTFVTTPDTVEISGGVPGEFAKTFVYCSQDQVALPMTTTDIGVSFDAPAGEVVCDWYNTPIDLSGNGDDDDVDQLPNTGAGVTAVQSSALYFALLLGLSTAGAASLAAIRRSA